MTNFTELLIQSEISRIPSSLKKFAFREKNPSRDEQTWGYFAYGYSRGFEELAEASLKRWPAGNYMRLPLFFLARHSIELGIKEAILEYSPCTGIDVQIDGHGLHSLWNQLLRQVNGAGFQTDDEWTRYCAKLVQHFHNADPNGEQFRYPSSKEGEKHEYTRVELETLMKAQWHLFTYCEAVVSMLEESKP